MFSSGNGNEGILQAVDQAALSEEDIHVITRHDSSNTRGTQHIMSNTRGKQHIMITTRGEQ